MWLNAGWWAYMMTTPDAATSPPEAALSVPLPSVSPEPAMRCHTQIVPLSVDQLPTYLDMLAQATIRVWESSPRDTAPDHVRTAMASLSEAGATLDPLARAADAVVTAALPTGDSKAVWCEHDLRVLIVALKSALRQLRYSEEAQGVLRLCEALSKAASTQPLDGAAATRLVAGLMVTEDATCAVEGYRAHGCFDLVDEAYLAKFGLLQALQLGFDAAQRVCRELGVNSRADASKEGKSVKITRHIVAGHPLGGTMLGQSWHHFHDRSSAQDNEFIRIMSFLDDGTWSGQSQSTGELIKNGLEVIRDLLQQARDRLPDTVPADAPGLMFPEHEWAKRYYDGKPQ